MGVSFKIARTGSRYRHKLPPADPAADEEVAPEPPGREVSLLSLGDDIVNNSSFPDKGGNNCVEQEPETSFALNLFPSGFSIGKPTEDMPFPFLGDVHKLHPYDRASQALFSAIENGWLPGDILDDIPCKYLNGNIVCEVRDYRSCITKFNGHDPSGDELPKVQKVTLRMCSENVVNDLLSISDDSWTYNDLLQAEAQIIKALQPKLHLDPKPSMERFCGKPFLKQLDLGIYKRRSRGKQQDKPDTNHVFALDVSNHEVVKNSNSKECIVFRDRGVQSAPFAISGDMPYTKKNNLVASCSLSVSSSGAAILRSDPKRTIRGSCITLESSTLSNVKRSLSVAESSLISVKRAKQEPRESETSRVNMGQINMQFSQESRRKVIPSQNNCEASNLHCPNLGDQHFPQENYLTSTDKMSKQGTQKLAELCQQDLKRVIKEEPTGTRISYNPAKKVINGHALDITHINNNRSSHKKPLSDTRSSRPHLQRRSDILHVEKCPKKDNSSRKRKSSACPQASVGCSDNSPVPQLGGNERVSSVAPSGSFPIIAAVELQKDNTASVPADSIKKALNSASNIPSVQNNNLPLQKLKKSNADIQVASNSAKLGVSAGTGDACFLTDSSSVGNTSMQPISGANADHALHSRFSKILMVTQRHGLNKNKKTADRYPMTKSVSHCAVPPIEFLKPEDVEECQSLTDEVCMSKYLIGGSRNACKTRTLTFLRVRFFFTGSGIPFLVNESRCKLVLFQSEEPDNDEVGVTIVYGDEEKLFRIAPLPTPTFLRLNSLY
ncbi:protein PHYTOCHROME-DEPENDENT LATE-FLOWERING-like isoform X2 [Typha angustifolia]|uniref:protein PHYTOCHROME-DEPENDENT LATE-FLOWERING-like isoform X2 n=1 Tax=Typha angustifolia TaxID=59011 RepID=UPI003C2FA55F